MAISREEVLHVARLARLELSEDEIERFQGQLSAILDAVSKVSELDLTDVPPTSHPLELANVWADDVPRPCLTVDEALANAPDRDEDYFRTPPAWARSWNPSVSLSVQTRCTFPATIHSGRRRPPWGHVDGWRRARRERDRHAAALG